MILWNNGEIPIGYKLGYIPMLVGYVGLGQVSTKASTHVSYALWTWNLWCFVNTMQYWWSNVWCFMICVCFISTRFVVLWTFPFWSSNVWHLFHEHWFHFKLKFRVWRWWYVCCFISNGFARCFMSTWSSVIDYLASLGLWTLFCFKGLGFGVGDLCAVLWTLDI